MEKGIPNHEKQIWGYEDIFTENKQIVCYYHRESEYLGRHKHKFYELNIVLEGCGEHFMGDFSCPAEEGSVFMILPGTEHGYKVKKNMVIFHILLSEFFFSLYHKELKNLDGYTLLFEIEPFLRGRISEKMLLKLTGEEKKKTFEKIKELSELSESHYEGKETLVSIYSLGIIGTLCRVMAEKKPFSRQKYPHSVPVEILKSLGYIHEHLTEKINFSSLANGYNMTYSTFLRQFKKVMNMSPLVYQNMRRMDMAKQLLKYSDESVAYIAAECGYFDSSHFIRLFEKEEGISPGIFRKSKMEL